MSAQPIFVYVVVDIPKPPKDLAVFARAVISHLTGNVLFPSPSPALGVCTEHVDELDTAIEATTTRARGTRQSCKAAAKRVRSDLRKLGNYVQSVLETLPVEADPEQAAHSAFMRLRRRARRTKAFLAARPGMVSGSVELVAKKVPRVLTYYWEYSLDQVTWFSVPETPQANTEILGLTPGKTYYFRFRTLKS
jgi:hypothetical protein